MNIGMLASLAAIVDHGSFAAAAQEVGCTPSAVSLQVKQLETYFGQPLFDRSGRSVKPTPFALEAAAVARDFSSRLEGLRSRTRTEVAGRVRLGAIATVQSGMLPRALRVLRDRHPGLDIGISLNDSAALLAELKAGTLDAAVVVRPQSGGSSRLAWQDLARQPFVMLVPPGVEGTSPGELLHKMGLVRYDAALTGGRVAAVLARRLHPAVRCVMELRSIDAIVAMVSEGLGVSIVPRPPKALLEAHGVREVNLGRKVPARQIALVRRSADSESRNIDALARALVEAAAGGAGA